MAPVVLAPLVAWLLSAFQTTTAAGVVEQGVSQTMLVLAVVVWVVVGSLALLIRNPSSGDLTGARRSRARVAGQPAGADYGPREMLRTAQFWIMFAMFFFGAAAGLMFISVASDLGKSALGSWAFLTVIVLAVGNAGGRIVAGMVSDRIGRQWTMFAEFVCQAVVVAVLFAVSDGAGTALILAVVFLLGFNYGSNLALFPAACKDYFGLRNFGLNYGCLFAAFGSAGLIMPYANGWLTDASGSSSVSYVVVIGLMVAGAILSQVSRALGRPRFVAAPRVGLRVGIE